MAAVEVVLSADELAQLDEIFGANEAVAGERYDARTMTLLDG